MSSQSGGINDNVRIVFDDAKVKAMLNIAPERVQQTVHRLLEQVGILGQSEMRQQTGVGATGDLRRSEHYFFSGGAEVTVEPTVDYAQDVDKGTSPHWVSVATGTSLYKWAMQKGINPYDVQKSIAKKGTKAHPFLQPTFDILEPKASRIFNNGVDALIGQLNG